MPAGRGLRVPSRSARGPLCNRCRRVAVLRNYSLQRVADNQLLTWCRRPWVTKVESCPLNDSLQVRLDHAVALARFGLEPVAIEDGHTAVPGVDQSSRLKAQ